MNGVGPIVALSPTSLHDSGMINPIDIREFQQNPSLWSANAHEGGQLVDLSYQSATMMVGLSVYLPQKRTGEPCGRLMTGRGTYNDEFIV
jgi:hypothetical protein